ncbi:MAG: hypothetical protein JNN07_25100 [Verrucomicrobiales bacterium]|nr:hypothetical protein [Verrucomicrobiales bacterium]
MRTILILVSLAVVPALSLLGQASLTYQNSLGIGKEKYIFMPDPSAPTVARYGGSLEDYATFTKVAGQGFFAELWMSPAKDQPEDTLRPVPGSVVTFRQGTTAGLIAGKPKLDIQGVQLQDTVTLQLRVWENFERTVKTWEEAIQMGSIRGSSPPFNYYFPHPEDFDLPNVTGNIAKGLTYFSLTVPEPSMGSLALIALSGLVFGRFSRRF